MSRNGLVFRWRLNNKLNITWPLGDTKLPTFECKKNILLSFNALIALEISVNTWLRRNLQASSNHSRSSENPWVLTNQDIFYHWARSWFISMRYEIFLISLDLWRHIQIRLRWLWQDPCWKNRQTFYLRVMEHSNNTRETLHAVGGSDTGHKLAESIVAVIAREQNNFRRGRYVLQVAGCKIDFKPEIVYLAVRLAWIALRVA